jgi:tetratricopeptide (TPR) repeat protein
MLCGSRGEVEQAEAIGNTLCSLVGNFMIGDQQLRLGNPQEAIRALERSGELATYCDAGSLAGLSRAWLAAARSRIGDLERELERFAGSLRLAREMGDRRGEGEIYRHRATALAAQLSPDWEPVVADYEASLRSFEALQARPYLARALQEYAVALQVAGRDDEARQALRRASRLFEEMGLSVTA